MTVFCFFFLFQFNYAIQEKFTAWRVNWNEIEKPILGQAIRAISVFQVKFNVEFTRQAVNFPMIYYYSLAFIWCKFHTIS